MKRLAILIFLPALLAGCALNVEMPETPEGHPARGEAGEAPYARPSGLLAAHHPIPGAEPRLFESGVEPEPDAGMEHPHGEGMEMEREGFTCTLHPEVTAAEPGYCPVCGMTLVPAAEAEAPMPAHEGHGDHGGDHGGHGQAGGVEP